MSPLSRATQHFMEQWNAPGVGTDTNYFNDSAASVLSAGWITKPTQCIDRATGQAAEATQEPQPSVPLLVHAIGMRLVDLSAVRGNTGTAQEGSEAPWAMDLLPSTLFCKGRLLPAMTALMVLYSPPPTLGYVQVT